MAAPTVAPPKLQGRAVALAWGTIAWNVVEAVVAIASGLVAGSLALIGFGIDCGRGRRRSAVGPMVDPVEVPPMI